MAKKTTQPSEEVRLAERLVNNELKLLVQEHRNGMLICAFADISIPVKKVQVADFTQLEPRTYKRPSETTAEGHIIVCKNPPILACKDCGMVMRSQRMKEHHCNTTPTPIETPKKEEPKKAELPKRKRGRPKKAK